MKLSSFEEEYNVVEFVFSLILLIWSSALPWKWTCLKMPVFRKALASLKIPAERYTLKSFSPLRLIGDEGVLSLCSNMLVTLEDALVEGCVVEEVVPG